MDDAERVAYDDEREPDVASAQHVLRFDEPTYHQNFSGFEAGMSAVDLLFNYGPEARSHLAERSHVEPLTTR
jgi:hypothetical protein